MNVNPFSYLIEKLKGKVNKSGDTMSGRLLINRPSSSTAVSWSELEMGNDTAEGTVGNSAGRLVLLGKGTKYTILDAPNSTANRTIDLPDKGGTIALTSDIPNCLKIDLTTYGTYSNYVHDFNDITTSGIYWCYVKIADTQNYPTSVNGALIVINSGGDGITQLYIERTSGHIYSRAYRNAWSAWISY